MDWKKIKKDLMLALSSHLLQKLVGYFVVVVLARILDQDRMGEFFFAAALAYVFAFMTDMGMNKYLIRRVAEAPGEATDAVSEALSVRVPLLVVSFAVLNAFIAVTKPELVDIMLLTSIYVFAGDFYFTFGALFVGLRQVGFRFITQLVGQSLAVILILGVIKADGGLTEILIAYSTANVLMLVGAIMAVRCRVGKLKLMRPLPVMRRVLPQALPFFILTFLSLIVFKVDTLMLGYFFPGGAEARYAEVARYEASYRIFEVSRFLVRPAATVFFPICAAMAVAGQWDKFSQVLRKLLIIAGGLGLAATVVIVAGGQWIVPFIYGEKYASSINVLRVLYLTTPTLYLGFVAMFLANSLHLESTAIRIMVIALGVNITLNALLIPMHGALGAAWATVVTETTVASALIWLVLARVRTSRAKQLAAQAGTPQETTSPPAGEELIEHEPTL